MFYNMEVTAVLPDELVSEVRHYTGGKSVNESLIVALKEWLTVMRIKELDSKVEAKPLEFSPDFSANAVRSLNRN